MNNRPASLVVAIFLWLIALAQLLRVLFRVNVRAGDVSIPLWVSILALHRAGGLGNLALARAPRIGRPHGANQDSRQGGTLTSS
jgi:hypothetical protein